LKRLTIWLNNDEYRQLLARARNESLSPYAFVKKLLLKDLICSTCTHADMVLGSS